MKKIYLPIVFIIATILSFFSVEAARAAEVKSQLTCDIPTTRTDGSALQVEEIGGYRFYEGATPDNLVQIADVPDANNCSYTVNYDLPIVETPYTYYYAATAYDTDGRESAFSEVVSKSFLLNSTANPSAPGGVGSTITCGPGCVLILINP